MCSHVALLSDCDPVAGQRSGCDYRLPASSGSLQERGDAEQQLLVKALFIQGELTELPAPPPHVQTGTSSTSLLLHTAGGNLSRLNLTLF